MAIRIAHEVGTRAVENADRAVVDGGAMLTGIEAFATGLRADKLDSLVFNEISEHADGVRAAAHAGDDEVWQLASPLDHLRLGLFGDDLVELAHDGRERVGPAAVPRR